METRYDPRALGRCVVALSSSGTLSMGHALNLLEGRRRVEMYLAYRLPSIRLLLATRRISTNEGGTDCPSANRRSIVTRAS